jgi:membrane associated rhomboid family serine protease
MTPWVTRLLIANVAVFFLTVAVPVLPVRPLVLVPALIPYRPWTLITYMFLHAGLWHILFNMLALFFFGPRLEARLGGRHFLGLYLVSGLTGALLSVPFSPFAQIVGASGAVFGVLLGFARYYPRERIYIWGILPIEARALVIIMTVLSLWGGFAGRGSGVAHFAHLGGFLGGFLYLKWRERRSPAALFKAKASPLANRKPPAPADVEKWRRIRREDLHPVNRDELDRILDKISAAGIASLTPDERAFLERFRSEE